MSNVDPLIAVTAGYAVLFVVLSVWARLRNAADLRRAEPPPPEVTIDPYHALAVTSGGPGGMDRAALAALLLDGLITIDADGVMTVAARTGEPAHPVPAAWLECLHRAERPAAMSELRDDPELRQRHTTFLERQDDLLAGWNQRRDDLIGLALLAATVPLGFFYAVRLVYAVPEWLLGTSTPERVSSGLLLTALLGVPLAGALIWVAFGSYQERPSPLRAHCAGLPRHPAIAGLTTDQEQRLLAGASAGKQ